MNGLGDGSEWRRRLCGVIGHLDDYRVIFMILVRLFCRNRLRNDERGRRDRPRLRWSADRDRVRITGVRVTGSGRGRSGSP